MRSRWDSAFGGPCEGASSELVVGFGLNNSPIIRESVRRVRPAGQRTLVDAVVNAAYDFNDPHRFEGVNKSVLIITGGPDECFRRQGAQIVKERLANRKIRPEYEIIGVGILERDRAEFESIARAGGGQSHYVVNEQQLEDLLVHILEVRPVSRNLYAIVQIINESLKYLNRSGKDMQVRNYLTARANAAKARSLAAETTIPYRDLARRRATETFMKIFEIAKGLRELQVRMVDLRKKQIEDLESGDVDGFNRTIGGFKALTDNYNRLVKQGNTLLQRVAQL